MAASLAACKVSSSTPLRAMSSRVWQNSARSLMTCWSVALVVVRVLLISIGVWG